MMETKRIEAFHTDKDGDTDVVHVYIDTQIREVAKELAEEYINPEDGRWCCFKPVEKGKQIPCGIGKYIVPDDGFIATYQENKAEYPFEVTPVHETDTHKWLLFHTQDVRKAVKFALQVEKEYMDIAVECMCSRGATVPINDEKIECEHEGTIMKFWNKGGINNEETNS